MQSDGFFNFLILIIYRLGIKNAYFYALIIFTWI